MRCAKYDCKIAFSELPNVCVTPLYKRHVCLRDISVQTSCMSAWRHWTNVTDLRVTPLCKSHVCLRDTTVQTSQMSAWHYCTNVLYMRDTTMQTSCMSAWHDCTSVTNVCVTPRYKRPLCLRGTAVQMFDVFHAITVHSCTCTAEQNAAVVMSSKGKFLLQLHRSRIFAAVHSNTAAHFSKCNSNIHNNSSSNSSSSKHSSGNQHTHQ